MGFSGNTEPSFIIPSCISVNDSVTGAGRRGGALEDLDFCIGQEALAASSTSTVSWPIRHGTVDNWDLMERYWAQCMFKCAPLPAPRAPPRPAHAHAAFLLSLPGTCA